MKNKKILIIVLIIFVIVIIGIWYYNKNIKQNETSSLERLEVKCVVECKEDEVCIKGACVKKKINYN